MSNYKKQIFSFFVLSCLFLSGFFLRTYHLAELPGALHRDELAIGYNALSLLEVGKDEYGKSWPLNFKSFGDYKLPGQIYTTAVSFKLLGVSIWSLRLPVALMGCLMILIAYFLGIELFADKKLGIILALLITFAFVHLASSRNVYEPISALTLSSLTILFFLKSRKKLYFIFLAICFLALSVLTYNAPVIILPPVLLISTWIYRKDFFKFKKIHLCLAGLFLLIFYLLMIHQTGVVSRGKSGATIFYSQELFDLRNNRIYQFAQSGVPTQIALSLENLKLVTSLTLLKNYFSVFSTDYLFFQGDHNPWHNLRNIGFGNLNMFLLPWILFGLFILLTKKKIEAEKFLLSYLLISPLPSILTMDSPITNRLLDFHFALLILTSYGVWQFYLKFKNTLWGKLSLIIGSAFYFGFTIYFLLHYFLLFNKNLDQTWYAGLAEAIYQVRQIENNYDQIYFDEQIQGSYLYVAFFTQFPPADFLQQTAEQNHDGYNRVDHFGKYIFAPQLIDKDKKVLIIIKPSEKPLGSKLIFEIKDWQEKVLWRAYEL